MDQNIAAMQWFFTGAHKNSRFFRDCHSPKNTCAKFEEICIMHKKIAAKNLGVPFLLNHPVYATNAKFSKDLRFTYI